MTDVSLSPAMGDYLNMLNSAVAPAGQIANENFARENMQLFNLGLYLLNQDGTQQTDINGNPIPTYTETQIQGFAKAYTGWTFASRTGGTQKKFTTTYNYNQPMVPIQSEHDETEKALLNGTVLPAGQTAQADLAGALTNIFNHPNVAPFVSRLLIQHLVEGDPSPGYVSRVASVFANDGNNVSGDMQSVLTAIFNDPEARAGDTGTSAATFGHLLDPVTWTTHLLRAVGYTNTNAGGYYIPLWKDEQSLGEGEYSANSVFNFYPPDYFIPGTSLNEPEFALENTGSIGQRRTLADSLLSNKVSGISIDLGSTSPLVQMASNPTSLVNELGLLFAQGNLDPNIQAAVISEITPLSSLQQRARIAIYLIATASAYKIEY